MQTRRTAWLGFAFLVGGLLLPCGLYAILVSFTEIHKERAVMLSIGCCLAMECIAFVLGINSRQHVPGKAAATAGGMIIGLSLGIVILNFVS